MKDVPNIQGVPDPRKSSEIGKDQDVDAEKFKRIMKVEESDEAKKHQKKQQAEGEDEDDIDAETNADSKVPQTAFSSFLEEPKSGDSMFEAGVGQKPTLTSSDSIDEGFETPTPSPIEVAGIKQPSAIKTASTPTPEPISTSSTDKPTTLKEQQQKPPKKEKTTKSLKKPAKAKPTQKTEKKTQKEPTKKTKSQPKTLKPTPPPSRKKEPSVTLGKLKIDEEKDSTASPPLSKTSPEDLNKHIPPDKAKKLKEKEKEVQDQMPIPLPKDLKKDLIPSTKTESKKVERKKKTSKPAVTEKAPEDKNKGKAPLITGETSSGPAFETSPQVEQVAPPAYTSLPSQVFDLFERLVGFMTIEQYKGVSKTTVKLNMPGSVFHGSQIVLEHHKTAPHAFNLQLQGSPKAIELFNANLTNLNAAFAGAKLSFEVNIRTPVLLKGHRPLIRRKGKTGEGKSGDQSSS